MTERVTLARRKGSGQQVSAALSAAAVCRVPPGSAGSTLQSVLPCCLALEMELLENSLGEKMHKLIIKKKKPILIFILSTSNLLYTHMKDGVKEFINHLTEELRLN